MKITHKREISLESERRITIKFSDASTEDHCEACETIARFVTVDEATVLTETTSLEIFRSVESGDVHFQETQRGRLLICFTSLMKIPGRELRLLSNPSE